MGLNLLVWLAMSAVMAPQAKSTRAELLVTVVDPSGAVVVGATVTIRPEGRDDVPALTIQTDAHGRGLFDGLGAGTYQLRADADGFEPATTGSIALRPGRHERRVALGLARIFEDVTVTTTDRLRDVFSTILSREQIERLPDDPDLLEAALREMAGPGDVTLRVDGFTGIALPRTSDIQSVRFRRDEFSAEYHARGSVRIEITTRPGSGSVHGVVGSVLRDEALNARNAFVPIREPGRFEEHELQLSGPIWRGRTSFRTSVRTSGDYPTKPILASTTVGLVADQIRQPVRQFIASGQLRHAFPGSHVIGSYVERSWTMRDNLGVGGFSLPERAYSTSQHADAWMLSETGPIGRRMFSDFRFQLRNADSASYAASLSPGVVVLDAFQAGGAQIAGGRSAVTLQLAEDVDVTLGRRHAMRVGLQVDRQHTSSNELRNAGGTFTFSGLDDFASGRPATYTRRDGNPLVDFSQSQIGWYVQDDIRLTPSWMLTLGIRHERQSDVGGWRNPAPRAGLTWASGTPRPTSVYVGGGAFYEWLPADAYEQVLRVDGSRQWDVVVLRPGYPDAESGAQTVTLPNSRLQLAPDLRLPLVARVAARVRQRLTKTSEVTATMAVERSTSRFRGININEPLANGQRPDPRFGNVTQIESAADSLSRSLALSLNTALGRTSSATLTYQIGGAWSDTDDPFTLPADSRNPHADWGPSRFDVRHRLSGFFHVPIWKTLRVDARFGLSSAPPYTITTGRDDNGDTVLNDRPAGVVRNSARSAGQRTVAARASWRFGVGPPATEATIVTTRSGGDINTFIGTPGVTKRFSIVLYLDAQNVLNRVNYTGYSGVQTSPFFGKPTAALSPRQMQAGVQFVF